MMNIRPKLFYQICSSIHSNLCSPRLGRPCKSTLLCRVVEIGNARTHKVAGNLGKIESVSAGICPRDEETADRIASPMHETSMIESVVAWVFVGRRWNNRFGEVVPDRLVRERMPVIPPITRSFLMKLGRRI